MSKKRTNPSNTSTNSTQIPVTSFLIPGMFLSIVVFLLMINLIAAPTESVQASAVEGTNSLQSEEQNPSSASASTAAQSGDCSIGSRYPAEIRQWCNLIEDAAARYDLEPDILAAVMLQESGGNPQAYSGSGAVGLLQVMPRDGKAASFMCQNGPCFANRPTMDELFDPAFNVDYGARMLAGLIARTGSLREALLAYGPMDIGYRYADLVLTIMQNYR